ncbi:MAG: carboxypeptidase-like regulatory domain-containing protein, partial [Prolixibacteraceae bacterium]|nr:carboxypeptidase-like regulatory domain-containing protein [Prolixibacteraceae bacterium]
MKKIFKYMFIFLLASVCFTMQAQQTTTHTVEGTVTDAATGETIPHVTIVVKGKLSGGITDINGKFSIRAMRGEWLVFSFVGYESFEY